MELRERHTLRGVLLGIFFATFVLVCVWDGAQLCFEQQAFDDGAPPVFRVYVRASTLDQAQAACATINEADQAPPPDVDSLRAMLQI